MPRRSPIVKSLPPNVIRLDGGTQPRDKIDPGIVAEYSQRMVLGDVFPPVTVWHDGTDYWPSDGFHRIKAAAAAGRKAVEAEVHKGTQADARWASFSANQTHGLRRTNADKERAVRLALAVRSDLSDRAIAEHIGVHYNTVANHRAELAATGTITKCDSRTGKDGRTTDTARIGKGRKAAAAPPPAEPDPGTRPTPKVSESTAAVGMVYPGKMVSDFR